MVVPSKGHVLEATGEPLSLVNLAPDEYQEQGARVMLKLHIATGTIAVTPQRACHTLML